MGQYIDKSALVEEIEKRMQELRPTNTHKMQVGEKMDRDVLMWLNALTWVKKVIDTLEVKEVDFEKELDKEWNKCEPIDEGMGLEIASIEHEQFDNIAKHFYELGLKARKE